MGGRGVATAYKIGSNAGNIFWLDNAYALNVRVDYDGVLVDRFIRGMIGSKYCGGLFLYDKSILCGNHVAVYCSMVKPDYYLKGLRVRSRRKHNKRKNSRRRFAHSEVFLRMKHTVSGCRVFSV